MPEPAQNMSEQYHANPKVNFFGSTNYRNLNRKFGIKTDDRRRHMYVIGKTGMGKTTLMENMIINDIYAGHGVGLVDPHGDTAEKIINFIPPNRINDVVYFNPADVGYPIGFNILETINPDHKHLVASGLMGIFKKIWIDMWSSRMEYILNNTILALLDFPGTTLLGINRMLADANYRRRIVRNVRDPVVKAFWLNEFASYNDRYAQEAVAPIQNKIGQFLSASVIRNIVAQVKSRIDIRQIMDNKKIFIMTLSKGRIGEDNSRLLGGMLITKLQLSAMERVDMPEESRSDFFLYVDEFQNFATESFANILSEARKYHLSLTLAHQYMEQLDETVREAVIGNVGTTIAFRVGSTDSEILAKEFAPVFVEEDLINLTKYQIYLKLMIDGVSSKPFSAVTLPPIGQPTDSASKIIKVSRERYAVEQNKIEDKIARWSGMEILEDIPKEDDSGKIKEDDDNNDDNDSEDKQANIADRAEFEPAVKSFPIAKNDSGDERKNRPQTSQTNFPKKQFKAPKFEQTKKPNFKKRLANKTNFPLIKPLNQFQSIVDTKQKGISLTALSVEAKKTIEESTKPQIIQKQPPTIKTPNILPLQTQTIKESSKFYQPRKNTQTQPTDELGFIKEDALVQDSAPVMTDIKPDQVIDLN